jgi:hypothetical protein
MKPEIGEKGMRGNCLLGFMVILRRKQNKCNYFEKLINLIKFFFFLCILNHLVYYNVLRRSDIYILTEKYCNNFEDNLVI